MVDPIDTGFIQDRWGSYDKYVKHQEQIGNTKSINEDHLIGQSSDNELKKKTHGIGVALLGNAAAAA